MSKSNETDGLGMTLEEKILLLTNARGIPPLARLAFHGAAGVDDADKIMLGTLVESYTPDPRAAAATRHVNRAPLEFYRFQAKDRIEDWEYLAGVKFREDFDLAHRSSTQTVDPTRSELYVTERLLKDVRNGVGRNRKAASRTCSPTGIAVSRLDAMTRRGRLAQRSLVSFWLCEHIVGHEIWPKDVARYLKMDVRYIGPRFREALADVAGFYRLSVTSTSRAQMATYHEHEEKVA